MLHVIMLCYTTNDASAKSIANKAQTDTKCLESLHNLDVGHVLKGDAAASHADSRLQELVALRAGKSKLSGYCPISASSICIPYYIRLQMVEFRRRSDALILFQPDGLRS